MLDIERRLVEELYCHFLEKRSIQSGEEVLTDIWAFDANFSGRRKDTMIWGG